MPPVVLNIGWARAASTAFRQNFLARHPQVLAVDRGQPPSEGPGALLLQRLKLADDGQFLGEVPGLRAEWAVYQQAQPDRLVCLTDEELSIGLPGGVRPTAIAARCAALFPGARTLAIVRDQVEAIRSFYVLSQRDGLGDRAAFADWLVRFFLAPADGRSFSYLFTYAATLRSYREWQSTEDMLVLSHARLSADHAGAYIAVARWLGVSEAGCEGLPNKIVNASSPEIRPDQGRPEYPPDLEADIRSLFEEDNRELAAEFGVAFTA